MRVYLDNQLLNGAPRTLNEALDLGRGQCAAGNRIIIDIHLDEEKLDVDQLDEVAGLDLTGATVKLITADPGELIAGTYDQLMSVLNDLSLMHGDVAERIQSGETVAALETLATTLRLWDQAQQAVRDATELGGIDLEAVRQERPAIAAAIDTLTERLREIRRAISEQDWVALSDCLGYEMEPVIDGWRGMLVELSSMTATACGADDEGSATADSRRVEREG